MLRDQNINEGFDHADILIAYDYKVEIFSDYHFRIDGRLDVWPSRKKYWDKASRRSGTYDNLLVFVGENYPREKRI